MARTYIVAPGVYVEETSTRSYILAPGVYVSEQWLDPAPEFLVDLAIIAAWQPADPPPQQQRRLNPALLAPAVVAANPPYSITAWLSAVIQAWQPSDPLPHQIRKLSPGIPGQSVDQPPFVNEGRNTTATPIVQAWQPVDLQPTLPRYLAQVSVTYVPYTPTWLSGVLQAWQSPEPQPFLGGQQPLAGRALPQPLGPITANAAITEADDTLSATATVSQPVVTQLPGGGKRRRHGAGDQPLPRELTRGDTKRAKIAGDLVAEHLAEVVSIASARLVEQDDGVKARASISRNAGLRVREADDRLTATATIGWPDPTDEEMALILAA
jgi:hypothetical protein